MGKGEVGKGGAAPSSKVVRESESQRGFGLKREIEIKGKG